MIFQNEIELDKEYAISSKNRCMTWGMVPHEIKKPKYIVPGSGLADKRRAYGEIIEAYRFFGEKVIKSLEGIPILIMISDERGHLLDVMGDESIRSKIVGDGISTGCRIIEEEIGTNIISMTLSEDRPVQLIGDDHFHSHLENYSCYGVPFRSAGKGNLSGAVCITTDVKFHNPFFIVMLANLVDSIERELILKKQNKKLDIMNQIMIKNTKNAIVVTDEKGIVVEFNESAQTIFGYKKDRIIGKSIFKSPRTGHLFKNVLLNKMTYENIELKFKNCEGKMYVCIAEILPIYDEDSKLTGAFGQFRNITQRYLAEEKYNYLAYHDELTGLANRRCFSETLTRYIEGEDSVRDGMAIVFLDLDRLKMINDTFGHIKGDFLIRESANIIRECLTRGDHAFRIGGDEFVLLCFGIENKSQAQELGKKIIRAFNRTIVIDDNELHITASLGIVLYGEKQVSFEDCLIYADNALYKAKANGRNGYFIYESTLEKLYKDKLTLKLDIERALESEEFVLHYQPQVDIRDGSIVGVETLIRWQHKKRGLIFPNDFIPLAEETGLISQIGEWVIKKACLQLKKWRDMNIPIMKVSVNLSAHQFLKNDLAQIVEGILAETGLAPECLELEITESMTMEVNYAIKTIKQLSDLGVKISIDDFGTGYSSLNYLKKFEIDYLKIDKSFVNDIETDKSDANMIHTIILMAQNLGLEVVAEGVENKEQLKFLGNHDCDFVQGYYFSKPLTAENFESEFYSLQKNFIEKIE